MYVEKWLQNEGNDASSSPDFPVYSHIPWNSSCLETEAISRTFSVPFKWRRSFLLLCKVLSRHFVDILGSIYLYVIRSHDYNATPIILSTKNKNSVRCTPNQSTESTVWKQNPQTNNNIYIKIYIKGPLGGGIFIYNSMITYSTI